MSWKLLSAVLILASMLPAVQAFAVVIDDFEDGAFQIVAFGVGEEEVQLGLDPAHVVGGSRTVQLSSGLNADPIAASIVLSAGDDGLVFRSGNNGLMQDGVQIYWDFSAGTLTGSSLRVELDVAFSAPANLIVVFESSSGAVTIHNGYPSISGTIVFPFVTPSISPDQITRMSLVLTEAVPLLSFYEIREVRVSAPEPGATFLIAAAAAFLLLARFRRDADG